MKNPLQTVLEWWLRRWWRPDPAAQARIPQGQPAVVITGGSEGIGLALAHRFAAAGHTLLLVARSPDRLEAARTELQREDSARVILLALDITTPDAATRIAAALAGHGLYADVLVNNAGIGLGGEFTSHAPDAIALLIGVNVGALTSLTRQFLPDMCVRGRGGILNIGSLGGYASGPYQAAYYASKAYVMSFTRAVAHETRGQGVRVALVAPGPVETLFHSRMGSGTAFYRFFIPGQSPESVARSAFRGFRWGQRVILPGVFTPVLTLAMKLTPAIVVVPIIAVLLRPRGAGDARS